MIQFNSYSDILRFAIFNSKLSLNDVSKKLQECGFKANKSYLSKLQNGKLPPASDKLNEAIAEILDVDSIMLKTAAYKEKIPAEVLEHLLKTNSA